MYSSCGDFEPRQVTKKTIFLISDTIRHLLLTPTAAATGSALHRNGGATESAFVTPMPRSGNII